MNRNQKVEQKMKVVGKQVAKQVKKVVEKQAETLDDVEALKEGIVAILVSPAFLILNGVGRTVIEHWRLNERVALGLSEAQFIGMGLVVFRVDPRSATG